MVAGASRPMGGAAPTGAGKPTDRPDLYALDEDQLAYLREGQTYQAQALSPYAAHDDQAIYESSHDAVDLDDPIRPAFTRDVDRILNNAFYNRCMDKTQVFPFYRNDDVSRRSYHLQLVAQISLKIGRALRLNTSLIQAIALGHDLGHTPFGHGGERMLDELSRKYSGRCFNHNVQSVRLLRNISTNRLSLQTYNGILTHCGEKAFACYRPVPCEDFATLDAMMDDCYCVPGTSQNLRPSTLEGCVVRICDILAYLGKDRQDALNLGAISANDYRTDGEVLGATNAEYIQNATMNLIKNSLGKDYLTMDEEVFESLLRIKDQNSQLIYTSPQAHETLDSLIGPMMERIYDRCRRDLQENKKDAPIFRHHLDLWVMRFNPAYFEDDADVIVTDYIACMTDEYLIDLHNYLFPEHAVDKEAIYHSYFES